MESRRSPVQLRRVLLVVALFALCFSIIELSEVVELPFESWIAGASSSSLFTTARMTSLVRGFGYAGLFALMTLESASFPIPSEVVLPFSGYLVYLGLMNIEVALAVSAVAGLVGAVVDYYVAMRLGRAVVERFLLRFGVGQGSLQRADRWFSGNGAWTILVGRFVPLLRSVISFPAGLFRMRFGTFAAMTLAGSLGWSAILIYAGYAAGTLWDEILASSTGVITTGIVTLVAVVSAAYIAYFVYATRRSAVAPGTAD